MDLTSPAVVIVLGCLVVSSVFLAVWCWPLLASTRPITVVGRLAVLLGVVVSVLLLSFAVINDQFGFFSDWGDLLGAAPRVTSAQAGAAPSLAVRAAVARTPASAPSDAVRQTTSSFGTSYLVTGGVSRVTSQVLVSLPKGYADPANATRQYPVLLGFGGYPSTTHQLENTFKVLPTLASLQRTHTIAPVISVFLQPWTPAGRDTECVDGPGGARAGDQVETWAAVDVPAWLRAQFRVDAARTGWVTWGMSAGGWCAAASAMLHPDTFAAAIAFGGYFRPDWGNWRPFSPGDVRLRRYDLVDLASTAPPPVALWVFTSRSDSLSFSSTSALLAAARPPLSVTARIAVSGGHRLQIWQPWLSPALVWLGRSVSGFAPRP